MKYKSIKIVGWLSIFFGVLIVVFNDYVHGHWPVTAFLSDNPTHAERTIWATDSDIVISITGVLFCSAGMWLLSPWPYLHRAYWIGFVASPIFVWSFVWWILGGWDFMMTEGTTESWWIQNCLAAVFLIFCLFIPTYGRQIVFGITTIFYFVASMTLLAISLWSQTGRSGPLPFFH